jgi:glyoxylase-like metal-dependent hydrolase (beta-lactamase superfamily II)
MSTIGAAWQEVGPGVFRYRYSAFDLNVGAVVGDDEILVVDTRGWRAQAEELHRDLRRLRSLPWRQVVNTHAHFDHCFGNELFREAAIWGHERCAEMLRDRGEEQRERTIAALERHGREAAGPSAAFATGAAEALAEVEIVLPDRLVRERASLVVGGRPVELRHVGRGHTDNDLVVIVPDAGVVFAGDLVEEGAPPSFGDAFPLEWPATAARLLDIPAPVVVPGHGDVVDQAFVRAQVEELAAMAELCRMVQRGEVDPAAALARAPFPERYARAALERSAATA